MILKALKYKRHAENARQWDIIGNKEDYAYFGNLNLLVGKNASGKSRTILVLKEVADLLAGRINLKQAPFPTQSFDLIFQENDNEYKYFLDFKDRTIITETLCLNDTVILNRSEQTLIDSETNKIVKTNVEDHQLAITLQNANGIPYFYPLVAWGSSLKNYLFSNQLEKKHLVKNYLVTETEKLNPQGISNLVHTFHLGKENFGKRFVSEIRACMDELGYNSMTNIDIEKVGDCYGLCAQEEGRYIVSQDDMSQGMFRALSLFIFLTYARLSKDSLCILIDDVGEGLDFERSKAMIDVVIKKIHNSNIQYFMTTNDRYIMNQIPLRFWTVIDRNHTKSIYYDYINSKETFDDFRYTGLNNFDFLTTDFYKKGFGDLDPE